MANQQPHSAAEHDLRLTRLDHFNVPVRDLNVARRFYCDILGGLVLVEPDWQRHDAGQVRGAHLDIQLFNADGHINAYWQPWGQSAPDQLFPHRAFRIKANELDELMSRLEQAEVPCILVAQQQAEIGELVPTSMYFRDPDGNQLELRCEAYAFGPDVRVGPFDPTLQYYPWSRWRASVEPGGAR